MYETVLSVDTSYLFLFIWGPPADAVQELLLGAHRLLLAVLKDHMVPGIEPRGPMCTACAPPLEPSPLPSNFILMMKRGSGNELAKVEVRLEPWQLLS